MSSFKKFIKILILLFFIVASLSLAYDIFYGQFSIKENQKIESLIEDKELQLMDISAENENLKDEISLLKNNNEYVEHIARENLGLIKEDEEFIDDDPD
tara:strand:- start:475 stop:771 length:297 start_codon:yes stop_codon:yes gene_type:complete